MMQKSCRSDRGLLCYSKKRIINRMDIELSRESRRVKYLNLTYTYKYTFKLRDCYTVGKRKVSSIICEIMKKLYL